MNVLVTGGAGFIGSHLVDFSLSRGDKVHVLDDLSTGNIHNLRFSSRYIDLAVTLGDCCDREVVRNLVRQADLVFHLAAVVGMRLVMSDPLRTIETNIQATRTVLAEAANFGRPILVVSSSEVYGASGAVPLREDHALRLGSTTNARWAYAYSKAIGESLAAAYSTARALPVVTVRLFNTVGPRQTSKFGMVVPSLVLQALKNENMTVHGDGAQTRCFVHVSDVVPALYALATSPRAYGEVVNIGTDQEIAMLDLAILIKRLVQSEARITFTSHTQVFGDGFVDTTRRIPDISKAQHLIGFKPSTKLTDILEDVIDYGRHILAYDELGERLRVKGDIRESTDREVDHSPIAPVLVSLGARRVCSDA